MQYRPMIPLVQLIVNCDKVQKSTGTPDIATTILIDRYSTPWYKGVTKSVLKSRSSFGPPCISGSVSLTHSLAMF